MPMQKIAIIIIAAVILLGIGGFLVAINKRSSQITDNIRLTVVKDVSSVSYKETKLAQYIEITTDELEIPNHSFVKTGDEGLAHVILPDNSMSSLSKNTEMQINYETKQTLIFQTLGNAWFRVKKLTDRSFDVESPTTLASVRGTIFGVEIGDEDTVYVTESSVEVSQVATESSQKVYKNKQMLTQGKLAKLAAIIKNRPAQITDIPKEKLDSPWFRRNQIINEEFVKDVPKNFIRKIRTLEKIKQIDDEIKKQSAAKLLNKLENSPKSSEAFGFQKLNPQELMQKFNAGNLKDGRAACNFITTNEYEQYISQLETYKAFLGGLYEKLKDGFAMAAKACADGVVDAVEAEAISQQFKDITPTTTASGSENVINQLDPNMLKELQKNL